MTLPPHPRRRGEPLLALGALTLSWIAVRALAWQSPFPAELVAMKDIAARTAPQRLADASEASVAELTRQSKDIAARHLARGHGHPPAALSAAQSSEAPGSRSVTAAAWPIRAAIAGPTHQEGRQKAISGAGSDGSDAARAISKRWHVDSWFAWRPGSGTSIAGGPTLASVYGGSQAGFVARFDLVSSKAQPQAYARALRAPAADRGAQTDLALGVSARPLARVPLRLQAEARATYSQGRTFVRPALLAVTELPPIELPGDWRGEGYAQAGWVGGRFATGFVDGQARIERDIAPAAPVPVRIGVGAWGGAQKSAGRLDIGPTITLDLRDAAVPARVSLDYRHQVAGKALPASGIAVTLSTGF